MILTIGPAGKNATIDVPSHAHLLSPSLHSGDAPAARPHARRVRKNQTPSWRARALADRTWHLQRDVERTLLLQIFARASETITYAQQTRAAGSGRKCGHHRHRR